MSESIPHPLENPPERVPLEPGALADVPEAAGRRPRFGRWVLVLVILAVAMRLYTVNNSFLFFYHPDESGKVKQVLTNSRNFRHPLLLLTTSTAIFKAGHFAHTPQDAVIAGRLSSALFASLTVALAALLAWDLGGSFWAASATAIVVALARDLFELAHYMKEDPALLLGVVATLHTARRVMDRCTPERLAWLGLATAVAVSGKYLGVIMLAVALPVVALEGRRELSARRRWLWFGAAFLIAMAIFNYSFFNHPSGVRHALGREVGIATHGHRGLPRSIPHAYYLDLLFHQMPPLVTGLAGAYALLLAAQWRRSKRGEWLVPLTAVVLTAILSCTPIVSRRYFLQVYVLVTIMAALGAWRIAALLASYLRESAARLAVTAAVTFLFVAGIAYVCWPPLQTTALAFGRDDHQTLIAWVRANLPPDAVIAQDDRVNIPHDPHGEQARPRWEYDGLPRLPQTVFAKEFVSEFGPLDRMAKEGIQYVAVCQQTYDRFFEEGFEAQPEKRAWYATNREFYASLFARGEKVWSLDKGPNTYLEPGLALYRIAPLKPTPSAL